MKNNSHKLFPQLILKDEEHILEEIYVSPLGHLMVKFYRPLNKTWSVYNIGKWENELLPLIKNKIGEDMLLKT